MRSPVVLLSSAALSVLSCAVLSGPTASPAPLPPLPLASDVGASPPAADRALSASVADHIARYRSGLARFEVERVAETIVGEARRHQLDPGLVLAVIYVESRYNNFARSDAGALGLMQILPTTGEEIAERDGIPWYGPQTLFDPVVNVRLGVKYMKQLSDRYAHLPTALAAYNWGPGRIDRRLARGRPVPGAYSRLVLEAYDAAGDPHRS